MTRHEREGDARLDLRAYLLGSVAAGLPQIASDSILELADAMAAAQPATASIDVAWEAAEKAMAATEGPDYADVGWEVSIRSLRWDGSGTYIAKAEQRTFIDGSVLTTVESEPQLSAAAALHALAARLTAPGKSA